MTCPAQTHLLRMLEGALAPHELARLDEHLGGCRPCRAVVVDMARARPTGSLSTSTTQSVSGSEPRADDDDPVPLDPGRRYALLGLVGSGGMGRVHRALDRLTGRVVALKHVRTGAAADGHAPPASHLEALAQEFRTLATLRHPSIIGVLDYGVGAGQRPFFTMELLHDAEPVLPFAAGAPLAVRVDLLVQLLRALGYLHRRGILHRDLKPSNILVRRGAEGGPALQVLDFGLSTGTDDLRRYRAAGTLLYMAPELLRGEAASEASDVYAAGVLACEVLAGRHPFAGWTDRRQLVRRVLAGAPDLDGLAPRLRALLDRMLASSPADRPAASEEIVRALSEATGVAVPPAPATARDSHLAAAKLVGRDRELDELCRALDGARRGRGSAWLVGGESGAGKSRLLDELRTRALVEGVLVAHGQAAQGDAAYGVWRGLLPIVALHADLNDWEVSVLATILPGLDALLEREVRPLSELDVERKRYRLLRVLGDVVARSPEPVLLILEDLQWADAESLGLLAQVAAEAAGRPLLVAASYRDDEAPRLPAALPGMRATRLERLGRPSVARLCEAMLGPAGRDAGLVDLIARETEGNALFIVEAMRALAEESGGLDAVGRRGLPERILAGGVERVLDRRLARAPEEARGLLRRAAVAGRQLDLAVLSRGEPAIEALVQACADVGVLGVREQRWQFDHDKLRERVLAGLSPGELRALHARLAEDLTETYPQSRAHAARVAYHLREAGRLAEAARFYALAGEDALARGAPADAEAMLEQALALQGPAPSAPDLSQARLWRQLALARFALGQLRGADEALQKLFTYSGLPLPSTAAGWCATLGREVLEQAARRAGLARLLPARTLAPVDRALREELLRGFPAGEVYIWLARPELALLCTLCGLNLEEALSARSDTSSLAGLAYLLSHTPLWRLGQRYLDQAARLAPPGSRAEIDCFRIQSMIDLHAGRRAEGLRSAERAVALARGTRDEVLLLLCLFQLQLAVTAREDFPRMLDLCREMEALAARTQNPRHLVLALVGRGGAETMVGDPEEAEAAFERALAIVGDDVGPPLSAVAFGVAARCALQGGRLALAEERADAALLAVRRARWPLEELRLALSCALDVYLTLDPRADRDARAAEALSRLHVIARRFPSAESNAWLFEGRHRMRGGDARGAAAAMRRSLDAATRVDSSADQAFARFWLGRLAATPAGRAHVPEGAAAHFEAARALFERLAMVGEAERARDAARAFGPARRRGTMAA